MSCFHDLKGPRRPRGYRTREHTARDKRRADRNAVELAAKCSGVDKVRARDEDGVLARGEAAFGLDRDNGRVTHVKELLLGARVLKTVTGHIHRHEARIVRRCFAEERVIVDPGRRRRELAELACELERAYKMLAAHGHDRTACEARTQHGPDRIDRRARLKHVADVREGEVVTIEAHLHRDHLRCVYRRGAEQLSSAHVHSGYDRVVELARQSTEVKEVLAVDEHRRGAIRSATRRVEQCDLYPLVVRENSKVLRVGAVVVADLDVHSACTVAITPVRRRDADDLVGRDILDDRDCDVAKAADHSRRVQEVVAGDRDDRAAEQRTMSRCHHEHARVGAESKLKRAYREVDSVLGELQHDHRWWVARARAANLCR
mmetsp:Transcript_84438/g.240031  ORF Transcript_84438/g.240031 Transcript_84438/m.240031 type:complete len:375 (+) Transcript_84438:7573-8697(+)